MTPLDLAAASLARLGVPMPAASGAIACRSPLDGSVLGYLPAATAVDHEAAVSRAADAFLRWREVPAPRRGEFVRLLGEELRAAKDDLAALVTLEAGKIPAEAAGEVQEMIDICDFATGLSRQLHGLTIASERPGHRMMETWHPAGITAVITAFNFPVAVWAWNAALALVCGNPVIWKPSEKTPLTARAVSAVAARAAEKFGGVPDGLLACLIGGADAGARLAEDPRIAVLSATGSTRMGRAVAPVVAARFGKMILELGGNNAGIVCPSADIDLALRAIAFSALGTAGQRCTTMRRLFVHQSVMDTLLPRLKSAFASAKVGDPRGEGVLLGPLIDEAAAEAMQAALEEARALGAVVTGGERLSGPGVYVRPALVEMPAQTGPMLRETFAPILYVLPYTDLSQAIDLNNAAGAGLSSAIFTTDLREAETFLSAAGSDCGIANVNIGTSGAEIGGAFGGEKETGGGRESGSDAWKGYMRRATNTVNYSRALPLAQGIRFDLPD
ncbi:MAG: aldehyde dehydrogenase family protein [Hyphomonas sp.]|uniref:L-piperidine-6-carboxylate dehydrogenase n=1 Tax=Hyphomonas sp. TaxID=87 RepID=UPI001DBB4FB0|nr:aldehyde dehydrogenase family protein [Hyphomonas sp.]MBA4225814.1 aldehyde dehydrogenase family protein [Hyphomonas sp.]